jgi:hypothetical protein
MTGAREGEPEVAQQLDGPVQPILVQPTGPGEGDEVVPGHGHLVPHGMVAESRDRHPRPALCVRGQVGEPLGQLVCGLRDARARSPRLHTRHVRRSRRPGRFRRRSTRWLERTRQPGEAQHPQPFRDPRDLGGQDPEVVAHHAGNATDAPAATAVKGPKGLLRPAR